MNRRFWAILLLVLVYTNMINFTSIEAQEVQQELIYNNTIDRPLIGQVPVFLFNTEQNLLEINQYFNDMKNRIKLLNLDGEYLENNKENPGEQNEIREEIKEDIEKQVGEDKFNEYKDLVDNDGIFVVNKPENNRYYLYSKADWNSKRSGFIYGSLAEIKIIEKQEEFSYVEAINYGSSRAIKGYIPNNLIKKINPNKKYTVIVDISEQRVFVYNEEGIKQKEFICSTGMDGCNTPTGRFLIGDRGTSFGSSTYTCYNWVRFNNNYLFHSVLYIPNTDKPIMKEFKKLGQKASHGCIRMLLEDIKWFYNNIPRNTLVVIAE